MNAQPVCVRMVRVRNKIRIKETRGARAYRLLLVLCLALALSQFAPAQTAALDPAALADSDADGGETAVPTPETAPPEVASPEPVAGEPGPIEASPVESLQPLQDPVSKRLFGFIPNYRADQDASTYTPLTAAEKFRIARSDSFDWPNYFLLAGYALQSQLAAGGGFAHNGGFAGFGEFYARGFGDQVIGNYLTEAILPTMLHEDPRYFRLGAGSFWHRVGYATSRLFVTRLDNGRVGFNISEVAGNVGVVTLTSLYYPDGRSAGEAGERYAMQLGNDAISNLLTEFWPDIKHHLRFRRHPFWVP